MIFQRFNEPFEPDSNEIRILFAVDMLKEAVDLKDGVDFLFTMKTSPISILDRTQIRGRAFRKRNNCSAAAHFVDFSKRSIKDEPKVDFFEESHAFKRFNYEPPTTVKLMILEKDQTDIVHTI